MRDFALLPHRLRGAPGALLGLLLMGLWLPAAAEPLAPASDAVESSAGDPAPLSDADDYLFALPTTHDHIGRVVVPAMVNGKGPFRFIVDTGATHSTISPGLAHTLGLKPAELPPITLNGITGTALVSAVTVDTLQTGDLTISGAVLPVVWAPVMAGADGIFGAAGLTEKSLSVDFQRNQVVISRGIGAKVRNESTRVHGVRATHGLITLPIRVGNVKALGVIDTGSERSLGNPALREALGARRGVGPGAVVQVTSVYGATKQVELGEIHGAPTISIESLRITDVAVVYGDFHIFKVWGMQTQPAMIIGMDVLGTVAALSIDFKNQDLYFAGPRLGPGWMPSNAGALGVSAQNK